MQNPKRREPMNHHRTAPATLGAKLRPVEADRQRPKAARSLRWTRAGAQPLTVFKSMSGAMNPKMTFQMAGIAPRATDQKAKAPAGWNWPPMILDHRAQNATKDATEKNRMNGRIRIIRHASVTAIIRTKSATGQSRMIRSTRIVQNGTSIEAVRKAAPKAAFKAGIKSALEASLGSGRRARQRHRAGS